MSCLNGECDREPVAGSLFCRPCMIRLDLTDPNTKTGGAIITLVVIGTFVAFGSCAYLLFQRAL